MLTRLNQIDGIESSSALLAEDGNRIIQVRVRKGAKATQVVDKVQSILREEVHDQTPVQLEGKSADAVGQKQDWLTVSQLSAIAASEGSSSRRFAQGNWWLVLAVVLALCAFLFWLLRRKRNIRQRNEAVNRGVSSRAFHSREMTS